MVQRDINVAVRAAAAPKAQYFELQAGSARFLLWIYSASKGIFRPFTEGDRMSFIRRAKWSFAGVSCLFVLAACGDDDSGSHGGSDAGPITIRDGAVTDTGSAVTDAGPIGAMCPEGACNLATSEGCGDGEACYLSEGEGGALVPMCFAVGVANGGQECTA